MKRRSFLKALLAFFAVPLVKLGATKPVITEGPGYIGAKFWYRSYIQNEAWVAIVETDLGDGKDPRKWINEYTRSKKIDLQSMDKWQERAVG